MCTRVVSVVGLLVAAHRAMNPLRATAPHAGAALSKAHVQLVRKGTATAFAGTVFPLTLTDPAREIV